jgi:hypothetical protein
MTIIGKTLIPLILKSGWWFIIIMLLKNNWNCLYICFIIKVTKQRMWTKFNNCYIYMNAHYEFVSYSNFVAIVTSGYRSKSWPLHFHMYILSSRLSILPLVDISFHLHTYIHLKLIYNKSTRYFSKWQIYFSN